MKLPREGREQQIIVEWLRGLGHFVYHIPNHRDMKKHEGALPGIPDLQIVLEDERVLWVEMKRRKGGRVDPDQKVIHAQLRALGHRVLVAKGAKEAREMILEAIK